MVNENEESPKFKRNMKGFMNVDQDSPIHITWGTSSPDSRKIGGKSSQQKSSNQLLESPKNPTRIRFHSSPILLVARKMPINTEKMELERQKIMEKFSKEIASLSYTPRNLQNHLTDDSDSQASNEGLLKMNKNSSDINMSDFEYDFSDIEDFAELDRIEEEAKKYLESQDQISTASTSYSTASTSYNNKPPSTSYNNASTSYSTASTSYSTASTSYKNKPSSTSYNNKPASIISNFAKKREVSPPPQVKKVEVQKKMELDDYDDDDYFLASIPIEQLTNANYVPKNSSSNSAQIQDQQPAAFKKSFSFQVSKPPPPSVQNTSVISIAQNGKYQINSNSMNQRRFFPYAQPSTSSSATGQQNQNRRCTPEEIAEKKRQALLKREALQKMRSTQMKQN